MIEVLRSPSLSVAHAARIALEGAGISAAVQGETLSGVFGNPFSVVILDDADLADAKRILGDASLGGDSPGGSR